MRAFIGFEIPEQIRKLYVSTCKSLHSSCNISFVRLDKMHITLAFFNDLPEKEIETVKNILLELKTEQFEIKCENMGLFKRKGIPSTVYIKIFSEGLHNYAEKLHSKLRELNINFDDKKPYTPHITLARINEMVNEQEFVKSYRYIAKSFKPSSFYVESVHLYSSDMITYKKEISEEFIKIFNDEEINEEI